MAQDDITSFEQDVAGATTNYFQNLQADPTLSSSRKRAISDQFFNDIVGIREAGNRQRSFGMRVEEHGYRMQRARENMQTARQRVADVGVADAIGASADSDIRGIIEDELSTPEEKTEAIRMSQFEALSRLPAGAATAGSWLSRKYGAALDLVKPTTQEPRPNVSPSQVMELARSGVDPAIIESDDPVLIGDALRQLEARQAARKEEEEQSEKYQKKLESIRNIDFATDEFDPNVEDTTRFKGGELVKTQIREVLALSPDPTIRAVVASDDPAELRAAYLQARMQANTPTSKAPRLPARP